MLRVLIVAAGLAVAGSAAAVDAFTLKEVEGGWLRMETETGRMSLCSRDGDTWTCRVLADDRDAYEAEIARLEDENAALKAELEARDAPESGTGEEEPLDLPSDDQIDQLMTFLEDMMGRFADMTDRLQERFGEPKPNESKPDAPDAEPGAEPDVPDQDRT